MKRRAIMPAISELANIAMRIRSALTYAYSRGPTATTGAAAVLSAGAGWLATTRARGSIEALCAGPTDGTRRGVLRPFSAMRRRSRREAFGMLNSSDLENELGGQPGAGHFANCVKTTMRWLSTRYG
jgi:hypothetical protein